MFIELEIDNATYNLTFAGRMVPQYFSEVADENFWRVLTNEQRWCGADLRALVYSGCKTAIPEIKPSQAAAMIREDTVDTIRAALREAAGLAIEALRMPQLLM